MRARRTVREISARPLAPSLLADLLWAAWGVNRRHGPFGMPGRTAASASNSQEIDLYVLRAEGAFLYDAHRHRLVPVVSRDLRHLALNPGQGLLGATAPVRLVFVVDLDRLEHTSGFEEPGLHDPAVQRSYYFVDTGMIAANVYLFAAATGLAAWFHNCQRSALARALGLGRRQRVLFAQTVGHARRSSGTTASSRSGVELRAGPRGRASASSLASAGAQTVKPFRGR
ncbi:MAG TPA: nitroreductase family protein [Myxococcaceae bacterium]|nr:nitroreductase family protein [Myxococcaceae bacterium]